MDKNLLLSQKEQQQMLPAFDEVLLFSLERRYLDIVNVDRLEMTTNPLQGAYDYKAHLRMMKIEEVSHEGEPRLGLHLLNMQNVLSAMKDDSQNVLSIINSTKEKTSLYYGLSKRVNTESDVSTHEYAEVLRQTLHGNFLGVKMRPMSSNDIFDEVLEPILSYDDIRAFPGIPSLRLKDPQGPYVQGIDRFIEGMRGEEYSLVTIAEPIPLHVVDAIIKNLFDLGTSIHSQVKATVQKMKGSSDTVNVGMFGMSADNTSQTETETTTTGENFMGPGGLITPIATTALAGIGALVGTLVAPGIGTAIGAAIGGKIGGLIAPAATYASGLPVGKMGSYSRSIANTIGRTTGRGLQGGYARGWNRSHAITQEMLNKTAEYCEKHCDTYIERLQAGKNLGLWNVGVYLLTNSKYTQLRAQGLLRAAFSGDTTYWEPIRSVKLNNEAIANYIYNFNNPKYNLFMFGEEERSVKESVTIGKKIKEYADKIGVKISDVMKRIDKGDEDAARMLEEIRSCPGNYSRSDIEKAWGEIKKAELGHPFGEIMGGVSTPLNTEELSIIMNVPRQEVQGITIREATPFGINYSPSHTGDDIRIGCVVHKRTPMDEIPYVIPRSLFQKHAFVCGVTGSGKTNTCITLLKNLKLPFLVIEPAKTEYRQMFNLMQDLKVFTLGSEMVSPFRINPFEFTPGCELLTHIDSIKAVFNAAFPMYASMPYILEEAIIEIYRDKGWDLATSTNRYLENLHSDEFFDYLPTLQDLYEKIEPIVKRKAYAQEQTMNIQAALLARLSSLLTGSKGLMLNTKRSTPISTLLENNVVLELKNIGDDDEKCFMMGLILSSIYQYRENSGGIGSPLKHVLLIEEAHRLLRRTPEFVSPEVGNSRGKAVETFTNVISEIREYGQGVIIVDQIPSKLTPDVVKNTNIKIIHRTLAQDDREYVGSTMNLTDAQCRELCLLEVGCAVIHREGADKAFLVQADLSKNGKIKHITNNKIHSQMHDFHSKNPNIFYRYYGLDKKVGLAEAFAKEDFRRPSSNLLRCAASSLIALMSGEKSSFASAKAAFATKLNNDLGICDDVRESCYAIYNANLLFSKLHEEYNGNYRKCLLAQKLFIDSWFENSTMKAKELRLAIGSFTNINKPYAAILRWLIKDFGGFNIDKIRKLTKNNSTDFSEIHCALHNILNIIMCGVSLSPQIMCDLLQLLLTEAINRNPRTESIVSNYKEFLKK